MRVQFQLLGRLVSFPCALQGSRELELVLLRAAVFTHLFK